MKRLAFVVVGFAVGLGPLWLTLSRETQSTPIEANPGRSISSSPDAPSQRTQERNEVHSSSDCSPPSNCALPQTNLKSEELAPSKKIARLINE